MPSITLRENVTLPDDVRTIQVQVSPTWVRVTLDNLHTPGFDHVVVSLTWQQLTDVELLSNRFDTETVRTFRMLIEMLGHIYSRRPQLEEVW